MGRVGSSIRRWKRTLGVSTPWGRSRHVTKNIGNGKASQESKALIGGDNYSPVSANLTLVKTFDESEELTESEAEDVTEANNAEGTPTPEPIYDLEAGLAEDGTVDDREDIDDMDTIKCRRPSIGSQSYVPTEVLTDQVTPSPIRDAQDPSSMSPLYRRIDDECDVHMQHFSDDDETDVESLRILFSPAMKDQPSGLNSRTTTHKQNGQGQNLFGIVCRFLVFALVVAATSGRAAHLLQHQQVPDNVLNFVRQHCPSCLPETQGPDMSDLSQRRNFLNFRMNPTGAFLN